MLTIGIIAVVVIAAFVGGVLVYRNNQKKAEKIIQDAKNLEEKAENYIKQK